MSNDSKYEINMTEGPLAGKIILYAVPLMLSSILQAMLKFGLPAGLQGTLFSFSNVIIQSTINSFGSVVMAGNAAAANLEGFVYVGMNAFHYTAISFVGQNFGAGKKERINKVLFICLGYVTVVGLVMGNGFYFLGHRLLSIYSSEPEVINYGIIRMFYICVFYFLCGLMDTIVGALRGLGHSVMPMIVSLLGACVFRIIWINTIFKLSPTLPTLYISYPISWALTFMVHVICYIIVRKKLERITG